MTITEEIRKAVNELARHLSVTVNNTVIAQAIEKLIDLKIEAATLHASRGKGEGNG